ncbi:MAG: gamma-glutamylcyclotransferase family protein [Nostocoides sp.]
MDLPAAPCPDDALETPDRALRQMLVYGTLKEDQPIHGGATLPHLRTVRRGLQIPGHLFDLGEYPVATIDHEALRGQRAVTTSLRCDLVEIAPPSASDEEVEARLAAYDAYEDPGYRRVRIPLDDPECRAAWIYEWRGDTKDLVPIPSGVWTAPREGSTAEQL